jgi:hypothetical protein
VGPNFAVAGLANGSGTVIASLDAPADLAAGLGALLGAGASSSRVPDAVVVGVFASLPAAGAGRLPYRTSDFAEGDANSLLRIDARGAP